MDWRTPIGEVTLVPILTSVNLAPVGSSEHLTSRESGQDVLRRNPSGNQFFRASHGYFWICSYGVQSVGSVDLDELDNATGFRDLRSSSAVILFLIRTPSSPASLSTYYHNLHERNSPIFPWYWQYLLSFLLLLMFVRDQSLNPG